LVSSFLFRHEEDIMKLNSVTRKTTVLVDPTGVDGKDAWRTIFQEAREKFPNIATRIGAPTDVIDGEGEFEEGSRFSRPRVRQVAVVSVPRSKKAEATRVAAEGWKGVPSGDEFDRKVRSVVEGWVRTAALAGGLKAGEGVKLDPNQSALEADWLLVNFE
jgi:hypothetical protein